MIIRVKSINPNVTSLRFVMICSGVKFALPRLRKRGFPRAHKELCFQDLELV